MRRPHDTTPPAQEQTEFQARIAANLERVHYWVDGAGSGSPHANAMAITTLMFTVERLAAKVGELEEYIDKVVT